jgi:hypothetical protein
MTMPWLRQFYAGLSTRRSVFITKSVRVSILVDKVPLRPFIIQILAVFPVSIMISVFYTHLSMKYRHNLIVLTDSVVKTLFEMEG